MTYKTLFWRFKKEKKETKITYFRINEAQCYQVIYIKNSIGRRGICKCFNDICANRWISMFSSCPITPSLTTGHSTGWWTCPHACSSRHRTPLHRYGGQGSESQEMRAELLLFSSFTVCSHPSLLHLSSKCPLILLDISLFVILHLAQGCHVKLCCLYTATPGGAIYFCS